MTEPRKPSLYPDELFDDRDVAGDAERALLEAKNAESQRVFTATRSIFIRKRLVSDAVPDHPAALAELPDPDEDEGTPLLMAGVLWLRSRLGTLPPLADTDQVDDDEDEADAPPGTIPADDDRVRIPRGFRSQAEHLADRLQVHRRELVDFFRSPPGEPGQWLQDLLKLVDGLAGENELPQRSGAAVPPQQPSSIVGANNGGPSMASATEDTCITFPDIHDKRDLETLSENEAKALQAANVESQRSYLAVLHLLEKSYRLTKGRFDKDASNFERQAVLDAADASKLEEFGDSVFLLSVLGLARHNGNMDPAKGGDRLRKGPDDQVIDAPTGTVPADNDKVRIAAPFRGDVADAVREYEEHSQLFRNIVPILAELGRRDVLNGSTNRSTEFFAENLASVGKKLIEQRIGYKDPHLKLHVQEALSSQIGGRLDGRAASIDIDLPPLDENINENIVKENVEAVAALYYCAMLEQMKLFAVADKITEHFMSGSTPISKGLGGQRLYDYIRRATERFTETERRSIYGRAFGLAQGSVEIQIPNREFEDVWVRFLSSTSWYMRQADPSQQHQQITAQTVAKSATDLAVNLSLHGYGIGYFAAVELQKYVKEVLAMLSRQEVMAAYGTTTVWQLVERVSELYLGGSVNGVRHRTMATNGSRIILWLAKHSNELNEGTFRNKILLQDDLSPFVDRWLAVNGVQDHTVEKYSEPVATAQQPTIPSMSFETSTSLREAIDQLDAATPAVSESPNLGASN